MFPTYVSNLCFQVNYYLFLLVFLSTKDAPQYSLNNIFIWHLFYKEINKCFKFHGRGRLLVNGPPVHLSTWTDTDGGRVVMSTSWTRTDTDAGIFSQMDGSGRMDEFRPWRPDVNSTWPPWTTVRWRSTCPSGSRTAMLTRIVHLISIFSLVDGWMNSVRWGLVFTILFRTDIHYIIQQQKKADQKRPQFQWIVRL